MQLYWSLLVVGVLVLGLALGLGRGLTSTAVRSVSVAMDHADSQPWWHNVDQILFINLDDRKDRRTHMETLLAQTLGVPHDRFERVAAVRDTPGWKGCAQSHVKAVELALERRYRYVCILEDDFCPLVSSSEFSASIQKAWAVLPADFHVLMLGQTPIRMQRLHQDPLYRVKQALAMPGYIVAQEYLPVLLQAFRQALATERPIDLLTQKLQASDQWYGFFPPIARQLPGFSDIENRDTDYGYLEIQAHMLKFID